MIHFCRQRLFATAGGWWGLIYLLWGMLMAETVGATTKLADTTWIVGNGTVGPYLLTGRPLVADSLSFSDKQGQPLTNLAYQLHRDPNRLVFLSPLAQGDSLRAAYAALPFSLRSIYEAKLNTSSPITSGKTSRRVSSKGKPHASFTPFQLEIKGAKTFGFTAGNRHGGRTQQGLQLAINGRLTETITLTAAVSDRFSDRLASGATSSRLNNLEEFFFALQAPGFGARLGELHYAPTTGRGNQTRARNLSGVQLSMTGRGHRGEVAVGRVAGRKREIEFYGQAGRQGPYALTTGRRSVVPNSERVYLEGIRLVRGAQSDYTIDYFTGELTFSPGRVISDRDRLTVQFEQSIDAYRRTAALGNWGYQSASGRFAQQLAVEWEGDDPNGGIGFDLSPADRARLQGSNEEDLTIDGAEFVGEGHGEYLAFDSVGLQIYRYVGPENGEYNVRFSDTGPGEGSYVYLGGGVFGFVGSGRGDYTPEIRVNAPTSRTQVVNRLRYGDSPLGSLAMLFGMQVRQPNRLDKQSRFSAWGHDLSWSAGKPNSADTVDFQLGARWRRWGAVTIADFGMPLTDVARDWFLPVDQAPTDLEVIESQTKITLQPWLTINGGYGHLAGEYNGHRDAEGIIFGSSSGLGARIEHQRSTAVAAASDSIRFREVWSAGPTYHSPHWVSSISLHREERRLDLESGVRFDGWEITAGPPSFLFTLSEDRVYQIAEITKLTEQRKTIKVDGELSINSWGLDGKLQASRTERKGQTDQRLSRDYLGQSDWRWQWRKTGLTASLTYSLNRFDARDLLASYIPVTDGFGNYRYEDSLYLPDEAGDYLRVTGSQGPLRPAAEGYKTFNLRRNYGGDRSGGFSFWDNFSAEGQLSRREQVNPEQLSIFGWLAPWGRLQASFSPTEYLLADHETRIRLERRFPLRRGAWFLSGHYRRRFQRHGGSTQAWVDNQQSWELSAHGYTRKGGGSDWEVSLDQLGRDTRGAVVVTAADVRSIRGRGIYGYTCRSRLRLSAVGSLEEIHDRRSGTDTRVYGVAPGVTIPFSRQKNLGSIKMKLGYFFADMPRRGGLIPGAGRAYTAGHNARYSANGRLKMSGSLSGKLNLVADWSVGRRPIYRLNLQAVSRF